MQKKKLLPLLPLFVLALLLGMHFIQLSEIYPHPRGGYTTAEISSAVIVVNGGNILEAGYDNIAIRANEPSVLITILGGGYERSFNITVKNVDADSILITGAASIKKGTGTVQLTTTAAPRIVTDVRLKNIHANDSFSFAVMGDSRNDPIILKKILDDAGSKEPVFMVHLGDMVNSAEEYEEVLEIFDSTAVPIYAVPGNHDVMGRGRQYYSQTFGMYYNSFDFGTYHFIFLDNAGGSLGRAQMDWLSGDLKNSNNSTRFVFMHMPPFDPRPGEDHAMSDKNEVNEMMFLFEEYRVHTIFAGHVHSYLNNAQNGINYIITGGAGAPLSESSTYHYVLVNVSENSVTTTMINV